MAEWIALFERACAILDTVAVDGKVPFEWTVGGGTMLYRQYEHRMSKDIDIFLPDPQWLGMLSPRLNTEVERRMDRSGADYVEASNYLKFIWPDGEADFIVAAHLTDPYATPQLIQDRTVLVETPVEILAKKVLYRAADFTARDLFDLAFLIGTGEADALMRFGSVYRKQLAIIQSRIEAGPGLRNAFDAIAGIRFRPSYDECVETVRAFVARYPV